MPSYGNRRNFASEAAKKRRSANAATVVNRRRAKVGVNRLKLNPTVAKLVDRRILGKQELHTNAYSIRRVRHPNIPGNTADDIIQVIPDVSQGDRRSDRIGTDIRASSLTIKGQWTIPADEFPLLGNADRADISLRMFVVSCKAFCSLSQVRSNWTGGVVLRDQFFKAQAVPSAITGTYRDMVTPVNHELFTVHHDRRFNFRRGLCVPATYVPPSTEGQAHMPAIHSDFTIRLKVKNKKLMYNEPSDPEPSNWAPFLVSCWCYNNGAAPSNTGVPYLEAWDQMYFYPN